MKNGIVVLSVLFILLATHLPGQTNRFNIGIETGLNQLKIIGPEDKEEGVSTKRRFKPNIGFSIGPSFQYNFTKNLSFRTSFIHERKITFGEVYGKNDQKTMHSYLTIPVMFRFTAGKKIKFFVNPGLSLGYLLPPSKSFKKQDPGVSLGGGIAVPINKDWLLSLEYRSSEGWKDISHCCLNDKGTYKSKTTNLFLGVSYLTKELRSSSKKANLEEGRCIVGFGLKGGVNIAKVKNIDARNGDGLTTSYYGLFTFLKINKLALQPEFLLVRTGFEIRNSTNEIGVTYFEIPVMVKYYISENFNLQGGPYFSIQKSSYGEGGSQVNSALGLEYDLPKGFSVSGRYIRGQDMRKFGYVTKIDVFQLSVTYNFLG